MMVIPKKIKIILMTIIALFLLSLSNCVFGINLVPSGTEPSADYPGLHCVSPNKSWVANIPAGGSNFRIIYEATQKTISEPSIAYGLYLKSDKFKAEFSDPSIMQNFLYDSSKYTGSEGYNGDYGKGGLLDGKPEDGTYNLDPSTMNENDKNIVGRADQYASFYYGILQGGKGMDLSVNNESSTVLVDYNDKTYTIGPYYINVATGKLTNATKDSKTVLQQELSGTNKNPFYGMEPFASCEILGLNNKEGTNAVFINKEGQVIGFPNWGEEFYIRYTPAEGVTKVNPIIKITYLKKVTATITSYTAVGAAYDYSTTITTPHNAQVTAENLNVFLSTAKSGSGGSCNVSGLSTNVQHHPDKDGNCTGDTITVNCTVTIDNAGDLFQDLEDDSAAEVGVEWGECEIPLGLKDISMELGGNVWLDLPSTKTADITGIKSEEDKPFAGIEVRLYDENGNLVAISSTDNNGIYHFYKLNPLLKYYVKFIYNGQIYQATYYKNNLTGGYSNAQDLAREAFNKVFENIDSTPQNYKVGNEWHIAYALLSKLAKENGEYIENGKDEEGVIKALTFEDAWNQFLVYSAEKGSYEKAYTELTTWLRQQGVGSRDVSGVITFIKDCMIEASTFVTDPLSQNTIKYPVYDRFVVEDLDNPPENIETVTLDRTYYYLYTKQSDQSRFVDFGITRREQADVRVQKDVYKATVIINGKKHDYTYAKKNENDDGSWTVEVRAGDELYNGAYSYTREVRPSEYLYNEENKNLQVFVTYRIIVANRSQSLNATLNEIVDYYDADQYTFDGTLGENGNYIMKSYNNYDENGNITETYVNSYIGVDAKGSKMQNSSLVVSNHTSFAERESAKTLSNGNYNYSSVYLTGIKSPTGSDLLTPGEKAYVYLTFKANTDPVTGKVKLDQDLNTGNITVGKRNIAELNGYSTYYRENAVIPGYLNADNGIVSTPVSGKVAGIINTHSNSGSLEEVDLTENGDLRTSKTSEVENRLEVDTDKAPNLKLVISQDDEDTRRLTGFVYEDERTTENAKAVVGNGKYEEGETLINGVKAELVELVQNVDANGIFLGSYSGERIWGTNTYELQNGKLVFVGENTDRYISGAKESKVILTGPGILEVKPDELDENKGQYSFKSLPAGDFFIRFTYGDSAQTVLLNTDNEVNSLVGYKGLNAKSYNGQDYKTTTYQTEIDQNTKYNGIKGFTNYDNQNYHNNVTEIANNNLPSKDAMYYYDIDKSGMVQGASDAKDVYGYREKTNTWSSGANENTLLNNRAEILTSFEDLGTYQYETQEEQRTAQVNKINELIKNTLMVAQTGVIDTEVERNSKTTGGQGNNNKLPYTIGDIDLGLQERPKAQLKLNKEITNFKITLANGQELFSTNQSVHNLYYAKHDGHKGIYDSNLGLKLIGIQLGKNSKELPELIQAYMDEELSAGATAQATYSISVENIGEVDYIDNQFYYTGKSAYPGNGGYVSTTNAKQVIDCISNRSRFEENYQDVDASWTIKNASDIINSSTLSEDGKVQTDESKLDNDLINRQYLDKISTYNAIVTTDKLSKDLLPTLFNDNASKQSTTLILSALLSNSADENYIYNNLAEIIATSNTQGRRMAYSVVGNQEMSDQSLGNNASEDVYTSLDLVTPSEVDADSAQKIIILPPTGENRNVAQFVIISISAIMILIGGIIFIKKSFILK